MDDDILHWVRSQQESYRAVGGDASSTRFQQTGDEIERLRAIVSLLPTNQDGKPIIPIFDPKDGTAERLGVVFRYDVLQGY